MNLDKIDYNIRGAFTYNKYPFIKLFLIKLRFKMNRLRKIVIAITSLIIQGMYGSAERTQFSISAALYKRVVALKETIPTNLEKIAENLRQRLAAVDRLVLAANAARSLEIVRSNAANLSLHNLDHGTIILLWGYRQKGSRFVYS